MYAGSRLLRTISLGSPTRVHRAVIRVADDTWLSSGPIVKVVSSGKQVIIDGVAVRRLWAD